MADDGGRATERLLDAGHELGKNFSEALAMMASSQALAMMASVGLAPMPVAKGRPPAIGAQKSRPATTAGPDNDLRTHGWAMCQTLLTPSPVTSPLALSLTQR